MASMQHGLHATWPHLLLSNSWPTNFGDCERSRTYRDNQLEVLLKPNLSQQLRRKYTLAVRGAASGRTRNPAVGFVSNPDVLTCASFAVSAQTIPRLRLADSDPDSPRT